MSPKPGKQTDIQPWMRKTVTSWLLEVCEELQMEAEVYFVAVNMMDRMLVKLYFKREHFQLLAAASLMIASKLKETLPIMPDKVIIYTDNSISFDDLVVSKIRINCSIKIVIKNSFDIHGSRYLTPLR